MFSATLRFIAFVLVLTCVPLLGRAGVIKGTVRGANKEGLAFANVAVRGAATSTGANEQGQFQLRLPAGQYELVFQYVGYRPQTQPVRVLGGDTLLTVNANSHALMSRYQQPGNEKRMLVILNEGAADAWLGTRPEKAREFMRAYPANWLTANPVEKSR